MHCRSLLNVPLRTFTVEWQCRCAARRPSCLPQRPWAKYRQAINVFHILPNALIACYLMPASLLRSSRSCLLSYMPNFLRPRALSVPYGSRRWEGQRGVGRYARCGDPLRRQCADARLQPRKAASQQVELGALVTNRVRRPGGTSRSSPSAPVVRHKRQEAGGL